MRGTTPTHTFTLPLDASLIKAVKIIYAQEDKPIFCKRTADCVINGVTVEVTLTQEETFKFDCKKLVEIQLRALTVDGKALKSEPIIVTVSKCLDDEVLV